MLSLIQRYRELIVVGGLLVYPLASYLGKNQSVREPDRVDRAVLYVSAPLQGSLTGLFEGVAYVWTNYAALRGLVTKNRELEEENAKLKSRVNESEEARLENERLHALVAFGDRQAGSRIVARVIGVAPVAVPLSVRIDRGESDGVKKGMAAVTYEGIVGQVTRTTGRAADILLVTDSESRVGVRIQRSRARGTAVGKGSGPTLRLENVLRTEEIGDGDAVVTSGADGVFPPGLVVGKVVGLKRKPTGLFFEAEILPAVNLARFEEVLVLPGVTP